MADPPWTYHNFAMDETNQHGAASNVYDLMEDEDIAAIPVASWAAPEAVLVMWATWPKLKSAMAILEAWGFDYVTGLMWLKTLPNGTPRESGIGYWSLGVTEPILIGRIGAPRQDRTSTRAGLLIGEKGDALFVGTSRHHSRKPEGLQDYLERRLPIGPYLEMFARRPRAGWTTWGGDLGFRLSAEGVRRVELEPEDEQMTMWGPPESAMKERR